MTTKNETADINLDETLNKTDLGQIINDNKKPILIGFMVILIAIVAYSFFNYQQNISQEEDLTQAYEIKNTVFTPYFEDKIKTAELFQKLEKVPADLVGHVSLVPSLLEAIKKAHTASESELLSHLSLIESWYSNVKGQGKLDLFFTLSLIALYEDNKMEQKAITEVERLISQKSEVLKSHLYLTLGRLYTNVGNQEKAKSTFKYLLEKYPNSNEVSLAKIYLNKL